MQTTMTRYYAEGDQSRSSIVTIQTCPEEGLNSSTRTIQRGLLGLSVACATLSLIPPLRFAGSLALRSVAFISSTTICSDRWAKDDGMSRFLKIVKIATVGLGLAAVVAASPLLIVASLVADIGIQTFEMIKALYKGEWSKALAHASILVIDTLTLAAAVTGAWQLLVAASAVSAAAMLAIGVFVASHAKNRGDGFEAASYMALACLGVVSAISASEIRSTYKTNAYFSIKNTSKDDMNIYSCKGQITSIKPDETASFHIPNNETVPFYRSLFFGERGSAVFVHNTGTDKGFRLAADHFDYQTVILKNPMDPNHFPTLPIGGTAIVADKVA